jgi:SAM-dependent MidA family methyltransferase
VKLAKAAAECHGPITQSHFLQGLGIVARLESLLESIVSDEEGQNLISGCERLIGAPESKEAGTAAVHGDGDGMGLSYKAFCITRSGAHPPIPFRTA